MSHEARFEIFEVPGAEDRGSTDSGFDTEYGWHLRAANGRLIATAGESFTRQDDAVRAIDTFIRTTLTLIGAAVYAPPKIEITVLKEPLRETIEVTVTPNPLTDTTD